MNAPTRPVLRYHGGKWRLAPWIISHFPPHRVYTEAFGGAASVLMRKSRASLVEVLNDLDHEIVNLFRVLRDPEQAEHFCHLLRHTPYSRMEFAGSYEAIPGDPVEQARRTTVRSFMGFGSDSASGAQTGFRANGNRQNGHPAKDWGNLPSSLVAVTTRLQGVVIENRPGIEILRQHDAPATLHYVDPPYSRVTRSAHTLRAGKGYRHEMTEDQHRELSHVLHSLEGMVVLSGYGCEMYDTELYSDWQRHERETMADGALPRTEVLWLNQAGSTALAAHRRQLDLGATA